MSECLLHNIDGADPEHLDGTECQAPDIETLRRCCLAAAERALQQPQNLAAIQAILDSPEAERYRTIHQVLFTHSQQ